MYRLRFDAEATLNAGDDAFISGQTNSVGTVVNVSQFDHQQHALIVLEDKALAAIDSATLFVGAKQAIAKELLSLPYDEIDELPE